MLYYSSSYLGNHVFTTLEQLFQENICPENIVLVFDTNIVIYYRDFYIDPKGFMEKYRKTQIIHAIRYLNEQITRYNLIVYADIGVEESSREKSNFSLNREKEKQTSNAVNYILHLDYREIEQFINKKHVEPTIRAEGEYPNSMVSFFNHESKLKHPLIVMYILAMKIILLYNDFEAKNISARDAVERLGLFMRNEVDTIFAIAHLFSLHIFGGAEDFKSIIFPPKKLSNNEKLHYILKGAIDLVFPTIVNKIPALVFKSIPAELIPVLVTADRRISKLHSLVEIKVTSYDSENIVSYLPDVVEMSYLRDLNWNEGDWGVFKEMQKDDTHRLFKFDIKAGRDTTHLLPYIQPLENELMKYWNK